MKRTAHALVLATVFAANPAIQAQPTDAEKAAMRQACRGDFISLCAGVPAGGAAAFDCLKNHFAQLSSGCKAALQPLLAKPANVPTASKPMASGPSTAPAAATAVLTWPHRIVAEGADATVYQPQVISWPDRRTLTTRVAIEVSPDGGMPILGTMEVRFATATDLTTRSVWLSNPELISTRFPAADTEQAARLESRIRSVLATMPAKQVPLDMVLLSLHDHETGAPQVALNVEPPRIFSSARPASLLVFDGPPVLAPIKGTTLSTVVNTNWRVFHDSASHTWYMLNGGAWLSAPDASGPWWVAAKLPSAFSQLPNDVNFADVKKQIPGRALAVKDVPTVFVSMVPAEIIVTDGPPSFVPISGTRLDYVSNSAVAVFRDRTTGTLYYLVSGRWFSAPDFGGPWTYATPTLPDDFARIPPDSPRGAVLASVPGTVQAQKAIIQAQIPQQATLRRGAATVNVVYASAPQFEPIQGTPLSYAVNTSYDIVRYGDSYYTCYQGAWFIAPTPTGNWTLATVVPAPIYEIPPASPLYHCTYVKVYGVTPTTVTYGYTSGYTMGFVSAGVVVYGTGYYYPPYLYPAPMPIYYPYPVSYAGATYYNPATGAWANGGAIYGPYYGARGGTAYNPTTGAWAQGAAVYGPYGGAGAFSAYNPSTGGYAHGSAVWGPGGASANASWYNPRTGTSGVTSQASNAYGRWGSTTVAGPNQTVNMQSQSGARGAAGSFASTSGAQGAAARGAGGNSAGAVKTAGGDVYAGADGNVYKKTDSGWEKSSGGAWAPVTPPSTDSNPRAAGQQADSRADPQARPGAAEARRGPGAEGSGGWQQLENDRAAREGGAERQRQFSGQAGRLGGGFQRRR